MRFRFSIRDLLILMFGVGVLAATIRAHWDSTQTPMGPLAANGYLVFSCNLILLAIAAFSSRVSAPAVSSFSLAYLIFGLLFLICVLHGGFGAEEMGAQWELAQHSIMGIGLGITCGIGGYFINRSFGHKQNQKNEQSQ